MMEPGNTSALDWLGPPAYVLLGLVVVLTMVAFYRQSPGWLGLWWALGIPMVIAMTAILWTSSPDHRHWQLGPGPLIVAAVYAVVEQRLRRLMPTGSR